MRAQIVILSSFAMLWGLAAWGIIGAPPAFALLPPLVTALLIFVGRKLLPPSALADEEVRRIKRMVRFWSAVEGAAMVGAIIGLQRLHRPELIPAAIAAIVGLHFLPLARGFPQRWFYLTMAGLLGAALIAPALPLRFEMAFPLVAGAIVLWASAAAIMLSRGHGDRATSGA